LQKLKNFHCPLKQKLDDFRNGYISLDKIMEYLYGVDKGFKRKVVKLQEEYSKKKKEEYKKYL